MHILKCHESRFMQLMTSFHFNLRFSKEFLKHMLQNSLQDSQREARELLLLLQAWMGRSRYLISYILMLSEQLSFLKRKIIFGNVEQTSDRDERVICYIVNSAEYCHKTVSFFYILHPVDNGKMPYLLT